MRREIAELEILLEIVFNQLYGFVLLARDEYIKRIQWLEKVLAYIFILQWYVFLLDFVRYIFTLWNFYSYVKATLNDTKFSRKLGLCW